MGLSAECAAILWEDVSEPPSTVGVGQRMSGSTWEALDSSTLKPPVGSILSKQLSNFFF